MIQMIRFYGVSAFVAAWLASLASAGAQETRTQAPCSPVIDRTQGSVTINFTGGCTVGITPAQLKDIIDSVLAGRAIPPELLDRYEGISRQFGVTDAAVTNFFRILGANKVAIEDLDAKLREIAAQHLTLLKQTKSQEGDEPQVAALKQEAVGAIGAGDYTRAQTLLQQAFDADLAAARKAQDVVNRRYVTAARTKAEQGQLKLAQLQYAAAAEEFKAAADLVPTGEPLIRAEYLTALGGAAYSGGNYPLASSALAEALSLREKALSPDDANLASSLNNLALLYGAQGRYAEAEPLHKRALAIGEKMLGPDHPDVALRLNNLAALYVAQGRTAEAEPLFKRSLAIGEKMLGPEHPDVATNLNNLALLYVARGRTAEAEPLYTRSLAIAEKALGPEHPDVATRLNNLALLYVAQGRTAEAEPLYTRSLAIAEKALGPEHPSVATDLNNLAALYKAQGRTAEAEPLYKRAIAIGEKRLGPEHPDVAIWLNNLAVLYEVQGRTAEAEPLYKRALAIGEKALGPEHPDIATRLNNLAVLYDAQGRTAEAAPLFKRALAIDEKMLGPEHPTTESVRQNLEILLQQSAAPSAGTRPAKHRR
jgi:tetratricopeptide (TPR) repeat protein